MRKPTTWVLVANGTRARLLEIAGENAEPTELKGEALSWEHKKAQDIVSDRPGRTHDRFGPARHAVEPHSDPERQFARQFAEKIAGHLDEALHGGRYQRLVLIAAPALLGDLRQVLPEPVRQHVHGEHAKDFTHLPIKDLKAQVQSLL